MVNGGVAVADDDTEPDDNELLHGVPVLLLPLVMSLEALYGSGGMDSQLLAMDNDELVVFGIAVNARLSFRSQSSVLVVIVVVSTQSRDRISELSLVMDGEVTFESDELMS